MEGPHHTPWGSLWIPGWVALGKGEEKSVFPMEKGGWGEMRKAEPQEIERIV